MFFSLLHPHLFQVTQSALIRNPRNEALIIQRSDGTWSMPEGALAIGESWQDSLARAILHATGIATHTVASVLQIDNWDENGETFYVVTFDCRVPELELSILHKSQRIYAWVDAKRASEFTFYHPKIKERLVKLLSSSEDHLDT